MTTPWPQSETAYSIYSHLRCAILWLHGPAFQGLNSVTPIISKHKDTFCNINLYITFLCTALNKKYSLTIFYCTVPTLLYSQCLVIHCVQHSTKTAISLYCTILYCTVLYCTVPYYTVRYSAVLYCIVLYCTVLYCTVLYCIVLYCTVLYCIVPTSLYNQYILPVPSSNPGCNTKCSNISVTLTQFPQ